MRVLTLIKGNKLVVPLAFVAASAMLAVNELSYLYTSRYAQESKASMRSQIILGDLLVRMLNAETGQRGFLLTGRPEYLQPYEDAIAPVTQNLLELRQRYMHQAELLAMLTELELLSNQRMLEMAQTIDLKRSGLSQQALEKILDGGGRENMRRLRQISSALLDSEADQLTASYKSMHIAIILSRVSIAVLSVLCLLAILIYLRRNLELKTQQLELRRLLASERDQLGLLVRKRTDELTQLASYLQSAREDERSRLARNLHDDLGALLTSAKLDAARIKSRVDQVSPEAIELLAHLVGNLNSSIALGRKIIEDLRPSALNNLGLVATLEILAREFADGSDLRVHSSFEAVELTPDSQLMVYRLMQEACTNILKYAKAENVWLKLGMLDGVIIASVRDDGAGFDTENKLSSSYGLLGMRYRVEAAQGVLNIVSTPGQGTLIQALL